MKSWNELDENVRSFITTLREVSGKEDSVNKEQAEHIINKYNELLKEYRETIGGEEDENI